MRNEGKAKELAEVLDTLSDKVPHLLGTISDKVPALLRSIVDVLYSKEVAENMAESVGTFYKKLVEAGIPKEDALDMTRGYMISLRDVFKEVKSGRGMHIHVDDDEEDH